MIALIITVVINNQSPAWPIHISMYKDMASCQAAMRVEVPKAAAKYRLGGFGCITLDPPKKG